MKESVIGNYTQPNGTYDAELPEKLPTSQMVLRLPESPFHPVHVVTLVPKYLLMVECSFIQIYLSFQLLTSVNCRWPEEMTMICLLLLTLLTRLTSISHLGELQVFPEPARGAWILRPHIFFFCVLIPKTESFLYTKSFIWESNDFFSFFIFFGRFFWFFSLCTD